MTDAPKSSLHGWLPEEIAQLCAELGQPPFRARQLWRWLHVRRVTTWERMTNIPAALRSALAARFTLEPCVSRAVTGERTGTRKLLVGLQDGEAVETVIIPAGRRQTVCVSSQVGCRYGCAFCASGQAGFRRNLEAGEMVGQVLLAMQELAGPGGDAVRPDNLVFMGMGEPLDNYTAVLKAIRIMNAPEGLAIGARRITVSTCGLIAGIERLAGEGLQIELSVSLHAPEDGLRSRLLPVNRKYPLRELLTACAAYARTTGRIVTFEYVLIQGVNDARAQAVQLAGLLKPLPCRVNLIPLSAVEEFQGQPAPPAVARMFVDILARAGINATVRVSKGAEIQAACGQLRLRTLPPTTP